MQRSSARAASFLYLLPALVFAATYFPVATQNGGDVLAQTVTLPNNVQLNFYPRIVSVPAIPQQPVLPVHLPASRPRSRTIAVRSHPPTLTPESIAVPTPAPTVNPGNTTPARLVIPTIGLNVSIIGVGVTASGEMAVPSGTSNDVGWYDGGPKPGETGAAVLDAHVFAAFSKLKNIKAGDDIYVITAGNEKLHFVVSAARTFALSNLTSGMLFTQTQGRSLNLITCAGSLTPDHSTYDHRLIVYSTLES